MVGFNKLNGGAKKSEVKYMKLVDGNNKFRILPNSVLPGYTYWVKGANGKDLPFECLQYDRENERFVPSIPDPVKDLGIKDAKGEDLRCQWAYKCQVINDATGEVEVLQLKKGMLLEIISVAEDMEIDPTDLEEGTWITVKREKTGPAAFNVKYSVAQLKCKSQPLEEEFREKVAKAKKIEELFPKETYEEQLKRLKNHITGSDDSEDSNTADEDATEAMKDLD